MPRVHSVVEVAASYETVRPLYERADGLTALTPSWLNLTFEPLAGPLSPLEAGSKFRVSARPGGAGPTLEGIVEIVEASFEQDGATVTDTVVDGPFEHWRHRRTLTPRPAGTRIEDDLRYRGPPGGPVGSVMAPIVLRAVFAERRRRLHRRFGRRRD